MKVLDIMEPLQYWLNPEMTVQEAILAMRQAKRGHGLSVNGMVVLDSERKLVGMVSTQDIIRIVIPPGIYLDEEHGGLPWENFRQDRTEKIQQIRVESIMTEDVRVITMNDTVLRCADIMLVQRLRRLPVIGIAGTVVGIVYLRDVYNTVTQLLCEVEEVMG